MDRSRFNFSKFEVRFVEVYSVTMCERLFEDHEDVVKDWHEKMDKKRKETDLTMKQLFHIYLESSSLRHRQEHSQHGLGQPRIEDKSMGKVLKLTMANMLSYRVQIMGKQWTAKQVEKWCEQMDNEAQIKGEKTNPKLLPQLLSCVNNCEEKKEEGKKKKEEGKKKTMPHQQWGQFYHDRDRTLYAELRARQEPWPNRPSRECVNAAREPASGSPKNLESPVG